VSERLLWNVLAVKVLYELDESFCNLSIYYVKRRRVGHEYVPN
jgi:hypothetical protein